MISLYEDWCGALRFSMSISPMTSLTTFFLFFFGRSCRHWDWLHSLHCHRNHSAVPRISKILGPMTWHQEGWQLDQFLCFYSLVLMSAPHVLKFSTRNPHVFAILSFPLSPSIGICTCLRMFKYWHKGKDKEDTPCLTCVMLWSDNHAPHNDLTLWYFTPVRCLWHIMQLQ